MNQLRVMSFFLAAFLFATTVSADRAPESESIMIQQRNGAYELTVPVSRLVATIPRGDLVPVKNSSAAEESPQYFILEDDTLHLIISGWFVAEQGFPGFREYWEDRTNQWRDNGRPTPQAVSFARISGWDAILYDLATPFAANSHISAHWVQAGTWIDLHLSITSDRTTTENRAKLKSVLKTIQVRQKE